MEALKMESRMGNWNDERLDEMSRGLDDGFTKVDDHFERLEGEMKEAFTKVDNRFERIEGELKEAFAKVDSRFERIEGEIKEAAAKVDSRFERIEGDMKEGVAKGATKEEMGEVKGELRYLNEKFDRLLHALMVGGISFGITMLATIGGLVVTQV